MENLHTGGSGFIAGWVTTILKAVSIAVMNYPKTISFFFFGGGKKEKLLF